MTGTDMTSLPTIALLSRDLFFVMRIRNALRQLGYSLALAATEAELATALDASPALALVDFNAPVDWDVVAAAIAGHPAVPLVAFGAHTDVEGFRRSREAGVARVISNGAFSQQLPDLVERYARVDL